jgi:hypothetical protein
MQRLSTCVLLVACGGLAGCVTQEDDLELSSSEQMIGLDHIPNGVPVFNGSGFATTISDAGEIDLTNEFFQDLGVNGRRCVTCHAPTAGWTITPPQIQVIFELTQGGVIDDGLGLGAIFRTNDGSNSPTADVSTLAKRREAYSMLLTKGLIRVSMPVPTGPSVEFELVDVDDPYNHSSADDLSMFRRPLPSANIGALATVMWDGRETQAGKTIHFDLKQQANDATEGHAQGAPISDAQRESIATFQTELHFAQEWDYAAKSLHAAGASGGADALSEQEFHIGINDNFGDCIDADDTGCRVVGAPLGSGTRGDAFTPIVFDIYDAWTGSPGGGTNAARRAVARGEALFNTRPINISGVSGLNDEAAFGTPALVVGTCTTCHDTPNNGNHSVAAPLDIGLVTAARRTPDMPLYTFENKTTHEQKVVTDPGRAMITGRWKDIGRFKGPILRGLASRAPYFHNGSAASLMDAVNFYDVRFAMGLTAQDKSDLVAFLRTL